MNAQPATIAAGHVPLSELAQMHRAMVRVRQAETRLAQLFAAGEAPGFIHLSTGQEAIPVGVSWALEPRDAIASNHRGHGHALARGLDLNGFFAELLGRETGLCRGRGGSMHVADAQLGMLGANGIVGAGLSLALGAAWAEQVGGRSGVSVVYFGDGALAEGLLHECLNLSSLWSLPMVFVCENNGWSEFSATSDQVRIDLERLAHAYSIPSRDVDGNDVEAVALAAGEAVARARSGQGPSLLQCRTRRWRGHFEGDPQRYRPAEELADLKADDPLTHCAARLRAGGVSQVELDRDWTTITEEVEAAVVAARAGSVEPFAKALLDVYADA